MGGVWACLNQAAVPNYHGRMELFEERLEKSNASIIVDNRVLSFIF